MKRVLHLSHHYGCLKDHQFICNSLKLELESCFSLWNTILPQGCFSMSESLANQIWNKHKEYFQKFDYIITSDTAPLSRIILQNIDQFSGQLNIWVCNRFDYNLENDSSYYDIIKFASTHRKVKIIPYTEFERVWMSRFGIETDQETIRPIGLNIDIPLSEIETDEIGYGDDKRINLDQSGDVLISRYHNDNHFQNSKQLCQSFGLTSHHAKYRGIKELKKLVNNYSCFLVFPDQYSKLTAFELMQLSMPVILPSEELLLTLSTKSNYFFGSGVNDQTVKYCEWYNEYYKQFAVYFEDIAGIGEAVQLVKDNKEKLCSIMKACSLSHTNKTINQWKKIYDI